MVIDVVASAGVELDFKRIVLSGSNRVLTFTEREIVAAWSLEELSTCHIDW